MTRPRLDKNQQRLVWIENKLGKVEKYGFDLWKLDPKVKERLSAVTNSNVENALRGLVQSGYTAKIFSRFEALQV